MSAKDGHLGGDDYRRKFSQLSQFFQLAAIFQRRDGARGALRNESGFASPCLLDSTLLCDSDLTTLPAYIGKVKRRYESLSSPRAKFFIPRALRVSDVHSSPRQ